MDTTSISEFHQRIVRDTFPRGMSDEGALLLFAILHCYQIQVAGPVIADCSSEDGLLIHALTQRSCGEAVAGMWKGEDEPRADYAYWYHIWQKWGSYSRFDQLTPDERARMRRMMAELEQHPFVAWFVPEDFDPAAEPQ